MPTYEYLRKDGTQFDIIQKFSDAPLTECPDTGQPVKRIISGGSGVIYKGSGWYITDYKKNTGNGEKSSSDADSKTTSEKTSATESKTEPGKAPASDSAKTQQ